MGSPAITDIFWKNSTSKCNSYRLSFIISMPDWNQELIKLFQTIERVSLAMILTVLGWKKKKRVRSRTKREGLPSSG